MEILVKNEAEKAFVFEMIKWNLVPDMMITNHPINTKKFEDAWFIKMDRNIHARWIADKYRKKSIKTVVWSPEFSVWDLSFKLEF